MMTTVFNFGIMKLLSIVFSFRNEENNLDDLVNRVSKSISNLNDWNYELIFVNDSSEDNSEKKLIKLQKTSTTNGRPHQKTNNKTFLRI